MPKGQAYRRVFISRGYRDLTIEGSLRSGPPGNVVAPVALATLTLAIIYQALPNARVAWRDVLIGSALTALLSPWAASCWSSN